MSPRRLFGQVFERKDCPGRWYIRYPDPLAPKVAGKRPKYVVRSAGTNEKKAIALLNEVRRSIVAGTYDPPKREQAPGPPSPSVSEAVRAYLAAKEGEGAAESTLGIYRGAERRIAASPLGPRPVDATTPAHVEGFLAWRRERLFDGKGTGTVEGKQPSNATVALDLAVISASFARLVRLGELPANPCARVRKPKGRESQRVALNEAEAHALLRACPPGIRPLVLAGLTTGARFSELAGLTWADVDLASGLLRVLRRKNSTADALPMHPDLVRELQALREARAAGGTRTLPTGERVFLNPAGNPMKSPGAEWRRALEGAGLADRAGVDFHALRTTFASMFTAAGGSVEDLRSILGHSSLTVTQRYLRTSGARLRDGVERLPFGPAETAPVRQIGAPLRTSCVPVALGTGTDGCPVHPIGAGQVSAPQGDTPSSPPLLAAG